MRWEIKISIILILSSLFFYFLNYLTFHDATFIEKYILVQLGFLPLSVLLVTIVLNNLLERKERRERLEKLNIVIGSFFADIGKDLLRYLSKYDKEIGDLLHALAYLRKNVEYFPLLSEEIKKRKYRITLENINLYELRKYLLENKELVMNILDNPAIIEHETFTDLLWTLLYVTEKLKRTVDFESMPPDERRVLKSDLERLYRLLAYEWVKYIQYLRENHPNIFVYEIRSNPFVPHAYHARLTY